MQASGRLGWSVVCWSAFLLAPVVVGALLVSLYQQSTTEQLRRAYAAVVHGGDAIVACYQLFVAGTTEAPADLRQSATALGLTTAVQRALRDLSGVEGGMWHLGAGGGWNRNRSIPRSSRHVTGLR